MTLIGSEGIPDLHRAGNVLRPFTSFEFSLRLPPTLEAEKVKKCLEKYFIDKKTLCNAVCELTIHEGKQGYCAKPLSKELSDLLESSS